MSRRCTRPCELDVQPRRQKRDKKWSSSGGFITADSFVLTGCFLGSTFVPFHVSLCTMISVQFLVMARFTQENTSPRTPKRGCLWPSAIPLVNHWGFLCLFIVIVTKTHCQCTFMYWTMYRVRTVPQYTPYTPYTL